MSSIVEKYRNFCNFVRETGFFGTIKRYFNICVLACWEKHVNKLGIKNILVFFCESDMEDNARVFYEYLCENGYLKKYRMVWIVKRLEYCKKHFARKNVRFITWPWLTDSIYEKMRFYYYTRVAKFLFVTHPITDAKYKKEQIIVHLDHGAAPVKGRRLDAPLTTYDYLTAPSDFAVPLKMKFWKATPDQMLVLGSPRDDRIFCKKPKSTISSLISMEEAEKLIIVMPTFKQANSKNLGDSNIVDPYCLSVVETDSELYGLNELLKKQHMHMAVKIHPLQKMDHIKQTNLSNIHYITNEILFFNDIQVIDFLACGDALITDFSSVFFDFLHLNRPVAFFLNKMDDYTRGFIVDDPQELMPGDKIFNYEDMTAFLNKVDNGNDEYEAQRKELLHKMFKYNDQENCKRMAEFFSV